MIFSNYNKGIELLGIKIYETFECYKSTLQKMQLFQNPSTGNYF